MRCFDFFILIAVPYSSFCVKLAKKVAVVSKGRFRKMCLKSEQSEAWKQSLVSINAFISMFSYVKFPKASHISKIVTVTELSPDRFCDFFQNVPFSFHTGGCFEKMSPLFLRYFS